MKLSLVDTIRKLVRQATTAVGTPVGNWQGAAVQTTPLAVARSLQSWAVLSIVAPGLPDLAQFFARFNRLTSTMSLALAEEDGWTRVTVPAGTVAALKGILRVSNRVSGSVSVTTGGSGQAAVYLNGMLLRRVTGTATIPLMLEEGAHTLVVLGAAATLQVKVSADLEVQGDSDLPQAPVWRSVTTGYLDAQPGTAASTLSWFNEATVGGYRVLRRRPEAWWPSTLIPSSPPPVTWGQVVNVGVLLTNGTITLELATGDIDTDAATLAILTAQEGEITAGVSGTSLYIGATRVGTVSGVSYAMRDYDASNSELLLSVRCVLDPQLNASDTSWVGQTVSMGEMVEVYRENNTVQGPYTTVVDSQVETGATYQYVLQARGLIDESTWSSPSDARYVTAGDITPPAMISNLSVTVLNRVATAKFTAPTDTDYVGTKVVYRVEALADDSPRTFYEVVSIAGAVVTVTPSTMPTAGAGLTGYRMRFGDPASSISQFFYTVVSNTAGTLTLNLAPDSAVSHTGDDVYLYLDTEAAVILGGPGEATQAVFSPQGYGDFFFLPFDRSGNVTNENRTTGRWVYDTGDDLFSTEPVLAVRQLPASEQAYFTTDGMQNPALFAIFEVFSYSAAYPTGANATTISYRKKGAGSDATGLQTNTTNALPNAGGSFPFIVSSTQSVDNPAGTRRRYIGLSRTSDENWLRVWAIDNAGRQCSTLTFVVDFDETPEITTLETAISNVADTVTFTVGVDDDTQGVRWWMVPAEGSEPTSGSPQTVDTRTVRTFARTVALTLGSRKQLVVVPYPVHNGSVASGTPGETVTRDLMRTPRSFVNLDSKNAAGDRSAEKVTAKFSVIPEPEEVVASSAMTSFTAPNVINKTAAGWTVNQWAATNTKHYYVEVQPPVQGIVTPAPYTRKILTNTATSITFTGSPPATYTMSGATFRILDGGVDVRIRDVGTAGAPNRAGYVATTGTEIYDRATEFILEFFGTKTGCLAENERLMVVDADTRASLVGFAYSHSTDTGEATIGFTGTDDDAKFWRCYERKGSNAWPTLDSTSTGTLDPQYLRFSGAVSQQSYSHSVTGASGTWYAIAVPVNGLNEDGVRSTATLNLASLPSGLVSAHTIQEPTSSDITVYYLHSASLGGTVTISAYREDLGPASATNIVTGRTVTTDAVGSATDRGSYTHATGEVLTGTSGTPRKWNYTITHSGGTVKTATWEGFSPNPTYSATLNAGVSVWSNGTCSGGSTCLTPHVRRITWTVASGSIPDTDYVIAIDVSSDGGSTYAPAYEAAPSALYQDDYTECLYSDGGGEFRTWYYRVRVVKIYDWSTVETDLVNVNDTVAICSGTT